MKARERHSPGALIAQPTCALAEFSASPIFNLADNPNYRALVWEECYRLANATQKEELLRLAQRQGLLYAQQIPQQTNGVRMAAEKSPISHTLHDLLTGKVGQLEPVFPETISVEDGELDAAQRQAVARALATPDVSLLHGLPGTGKSRVLVEILTQAARRGWRTLFLAQHAASVDVVLEQLAGRDGVCPVRLTGGDDSVPPTIRPMLLEEGRKAFRAQLLEKARQGRDQAEDQCRRHKQHEEAGPRLLALVEALEKLQESMQALAKSREGLPAKVVARADDAGTPLGERMHTLCQAYQQTQAGLQTSLRDIEQKQQEVAEELQALGRQSDLLEPLQRARREGKWWTALWWRGLFRGNPALLLEEVELRKQALHDSRTELLCRYWDQLQRRQQAETAFDEERARVIEEATLREQTALSTESDRLQAEMQTLAEQWRSLVQRLFNQDGAEFSRAGLEKILAWWQNQQQIDEENCQYARRWLAFLEEEGDKLAGRFVNLANLLAATVAGWKQSALGGDDAFDLLVLEDADQFTLADLLPLANRARRCLLVSQNPPASEPSGPGSTPFQRLWNLFHADPSRLAYSWFQDGKRLCCQLRPLNPQERGRLECERLADAPDIELRIRPGSPPQLAQVVFPVGMTMPQAKEFIYRELQEIPIQTRGRNGWLEEETDSFVWHLEVAGPRAESRHGAALPVRLGEGLTEWLEGEDTCRLEFHKTHWTRGQICDWMKRHFGLTDLGRTMCLTVPQRMQPELAAWVEDVLFPAKGTAGRNGAGQGPTCVEFVPVPALRKGESRAGKLPREGAGLEVDLAGGRAPDRVPAEYLAGLPRAGYINFLEAQAVVRTLENLVSLGTDKIGVVAFHAGQVELLRRLVGRAGLLAGKVEVGLPQAFRGRECSVLVVSLTRSTSHRTGHMATDMGDVLLALTRARFRLILIGDPGTLIKWHPVEDRSSPRPPCWESQVCRYLHAKGSYQAAFHLCDGI